MADPPWLPPQNFLGLPPELCDPGTARSAVLPIPYEATTSYGAGTRRGPSAILEASTQVEFYDPELDAEPCRTGIHTYPALDLPAGDSRQALAMLRAVYGDLVRDALRTGRFLVGLGGEHGLTYPLVAAWHEALGRGAGLHVLQLDAHADLRNEYQGNRFSHACVMRRVVEEGVPVVAAGVRSISVEERDVIRERSLTVVFGHELGARGWVDRVLHALGPQVYLSIDVDFFDPSLMPATGTPQPGGASWAQALELLRRVFAERRVVAADVVELAPVPGLHAPDFAVAKLVYKLIGYRWNLRT